MSIAPIEDRRMAGIALLIIGCLMMTGIDSCAKWLVEAGMPPSVVVFVRYAVHVFLVLGLFLPMRGREIFVTGKPWIEVARGFCLLGATICNFLAVQFLPLTLTAAIIFTVPLWICALSIPMLGEQVGLRRWAAIIVGLCGGLIATQPWSASFHPAVFLSIGTAICNALYSILTRRLAGVDSTETQQFFAAALATVAVAPVAVIDWQWPNLGPDWLAFALIGLFGWAGHQALTIAHRFAPVSTLAPFIYVQMIWMAASSWIIFHQPPDIWVIAGAVIVLGSGLYVWLRERQLAKAGRVSVKTPEVMR